jgi:hypothetical protein
MEVGDVLKQAWAAVEASGVPKELEAVAFTVAVDILRAEYRPFDKPSVDGGVQAKVPVARKPKSKSGRSNSSGSRDDGSDLLPSVGTQSEFFRNIAKATDVSVERLGDIFHVEDGSVELKIPAKDLGSSKKGQMQTISVILAGAYFAGTDTPKVPFAAVYQVCKNKRCFDQANAATYLKSLPGFSALGTGSSQHLSTKSGWEKEFERAVLRVLKVVEEP